MKQNLANLSAAELADYMTKVALLEYAAKDQMSHTPDTQPEQMDKYGDLADGYHSILLDIFYEAQTRSGEVLSAFAPLLEHENPNVRLSAANALMREPFVEIALPVLHNLTKLERRDDDGSWLDITHIHIVFTAESLIRIYKTGSPVPSINEALNIIKNKQ